MYDCYSLERKRFVFVSSSSASRQEKGQQKRMSCQSVDRIEPGTETPSLRSLSEMRERAVIWFIQKPYLYLNHTEHTQLFLVWLHELAKPHEHQEESGSADKVCEESDTNNRIFVIPISKA